MDEFYNQFKENLENRPEPAYEPDDWNDMTQRLDQLQPKSSKWKRWAAVAALLLFLLANGGVLFWLWRTNNQMAHLNQKMQLSQKDTIVIKETIYHKDTVFLVQETSHTAPDLGALKQQQYLMQSLASLTQTLPYFSDRFSKQSTFSFFPPSSNSWRDMLREDEALASEEGVIIPRRTGSGSNFSDQKQNLLLNPLGKASFRLLDYSFLEPQFPALVMEEEAKPRIPLSYYFTPTTLKAGSALQANLIASSLPITGYNFGLGAAVELRFPTGLGLEAGAGFNYLSLAPNEGSDLSIYPDAMPNNAGDQLKHLTIYWTQMQYSLGIDYAFQWDKWNISLGGGVLARQFLNQQYQFEFIDGAGAEYYLQQERYYSDFGVNSYYVKLGNTWKFRKKWDLKVELLYQKDYQLAHPELVDFEEFGLRVSVLRNFLGS